MCVYILADFSPPCDSPRTITVVLTHKGMSKWIVGACICAATHEFFAFCFSFFFNIFFWYIFFLLFLLYLYIYIFTSPPFVSDFFSECDSFTYPPSVPAQPWAKRTRSRWTTLDPFLITLTLRSRRRRSPWKSPPRSRRAITSSSFLLTSLTLPT